MDWALQSYAAPCLALLRAAARARGVGSGRGEAAPLSTMTEHFHGCTDAEMAERIGAIAAQVNARQAAAEAREAARPPHGVTQGVLRYHPDAVAAHLRRVDATAAAAVAPLPLE